MDLQQCTLCLYTPVHTVHTTFIESKFWKLRCSKWEWSFNKLHVHVVHFLTIEISTLSFLFSTWCIHIIEVFTWREFSPFLSPALDSWARFFPTKVLFHVNDYREPMVIFTAWTKLYSIKYFCDVRVAGLGKIFVQRKFWLYGNYTTNNNIFNARSFCNTCTCTVTVYVQC